MVSLRFGICEILQYFLNLFYTKTRLSKSLLPNETTLKIFLTDMKNANRTQTVFFFKTVQKAALFVITFTQAIFY